MSLGRRWIDEAAGESRKDRPNANSVLMKADLRQLDLVVALPIERTPLISQGEYGGIHEFTFP